MADQPEALRLADWIESESPPTEEASCADVAAELRRLHDLVDKYKWQVRDTCVRAEKAEAQRDELLNALTVLIGRAEARGIPCNAARAAIAKAEGK
jgi:hypothetical protein